MTDTSVPARAESRSIDLFGLLARFAPLIFLIALMILFAAVQPRFLSSINLFNVMRQVSIIGLLAVSVYAVGGNPEAARLSGLNVRRTFAASTSSWGSSPGSARSSWRRG